ncbi:1,4-dihydroxy-2-naphthoate polyprenyltransferase [Ferrimonas lipolytica]|uniref:1,4-dihydroxy-2-naphthoate octaprenyltransferase n=1 Tax=Ferrimonas lipolytica TaxID=2724191 RepID=A0A6H1U9Y8_9GAMM|nr:1,4-dihydroxy-2-naphthoate polyprenyltransferase [Ferrimonas lipolytica]QIZ75638.1 1,4-dihydroxy-2-naphthoate polyprenyltransferase [Ferrimonas lipolytica]
MTLHSWLLAIRPRTLPAAIGPLLLGNMLAFVDGQFSILVAVSSMLCGILLQIGVNLANDYFDFKSGVDTEERLGPVRVTQSGLISPNAVRNGMILSLVMAVLVGLYLIYVGGPIVAGLAVFAVLGALCYSGGPYPLASHGLGEVAAFVFFGLVAVVGSYFTQTHTSTLDVWLLASTMGLFNAAIMLVNNTRDIQTDRKAGKRTLAVRIGQQQSRILYCTLLALPYLVLSLMFLLGHLPGLVVLLGFISVPMAKMLAGEFRKSEGAALNPLLGRTAKLTMVYSVLLSLGLPLSQLT